MRKAKSKRVKEATPIPFEQFSSLVVEWRCRICHEKHILSISDCSHPLRSGVLREGRYAPFSNTSRPWLVVSPGRELFAPCGEKDPPTHACLLRNLPKKVVCAKTSTFQLRKMVTHLHAADAQPLAELAPRRMRLSCRLSVRALGESYDSLPLPKQRPAC